MSEATTKVIGMTADQITSVSSALTSTISGIMDTFVSLVPIIGVTAGAIFGIRFVKKRFNKVEKAG